MTVNAVADIHSGRTDARSAGSRPGIEKMIAGRMKMLFTQS